MRFCVILFAVVVLGSTSALFGQGAGDDGDEPPRKPKTTDQLTRDLASLESKLQALTHDVSQLVGLIDTMKDNQGALSQNLKNTNVEVASLKKDVEDLREEIREERVKQREILEAISRTDGGGRYIPKLSAIMDTSPEFADEVAGVVHRSLKRTGTMTIVNKTNSYQRIMVNRVEYGVEPGKAQTVKNLPVGTVTTRMQGEGTKHWTLTAPDYEQDIEIVPDDEPAPVRVSRPIITTPSPVYEYPTTTYVRRYPVTYYWP